MSSELIKVPFESGEILCVRTERGEYVVLKPLCESLGISHDAQRRRILRESWGKNSTTKMDVELPGSQGEREVFGLDRRRIGMWLATLTATKIKDPAAREALAALQERAADVLDRHFSGQTAPQAPAKLDSLRALHLLTTELLQAQDQVQALAVQQAVVVGQVAEVKGQVGEVADRVARIEQQQAAAAKVLSELPKSPTQAAPITTRKKVGLLVNAYCRATGADHQATWSELYRQLLIRYSFDAKIRASNRRVRPIDVVEAGGRLEQLFAIASELCQIPGKQAA